MENKEWNKKFEILTQIEELEAKQARAVREAVLDLAKAMNVQVPKLEALEDNIKKRRNKL